ncbi:MAG TPA: FAD-dependent oxidoreductase [Candidatus Sulfotelmatobacter sp.]|jgi:ferredoxin-NADP reductase|nr:FAD-dependent oxidoreductase [Candidatus Sulfotelmatobacter sp.]
MNNSQTYSIPFLSKTKLSKSTYVFYFKKPQGFDFNPGQYNRWTLPITANDGRGSSRFFTIFSSPLNKDTISFATRIGESNYKTALFQLKKGDEIKIFGPMGQFVFNQKSTKPQAFIAGGIGITPFHSFLQYAAEKNLKIPILLFASFSTLEEMVYFDELKKIESQNPNIKIIYIITTLEEAQTSWSGESGNISDALLKNYIVEIKKCVFYIVGSSPMVDRATKMLIEMKVPIEHIKTEQFTGF